MFVNHYTTNKIHTYWSYPVGIAEIKTTKCTLNFVLFESETEQFDNTVIV